MSFYYWATFLLAAFALASTNAGKQFELILKLLFTDSFQIHLNIVNLKFI